MHKSLHEKMPFNIRLMQISVQNPCPCRIRRYIKEYKPAAGTGATVLAKKIRPSRDGLGFSISALPNFKVSLGIIRV